MTLDDPSASRALVVEDDVAVAATLAEMLHVLGYEIRTAATAPEGLGLVETFLPDVVLLDLRLPGMSGIDALPYFRQRHPRLPVIVVTSNIDPEVAQLVLRQGAFGYIQKPFDMAATEGLLAAAIRQAAGAEAAAIRCAFCRTPISATAGKKTVDGVVYHHGCWDRKVRSEKR